MNTDKKMSLTARVILGMGLGILTGFIIRLAFSENQFINNYLVNGLFDVGGSIFIASLKVILQVPFRLIGLPLF